MWRLLGPGIFLKLKAFQNSFHNKLVIDTQAQTAKDICLFAIVSTIVYRLKFYLMLRIYQFNLLNWTKRNMKKKYLAHQTVRVQGDYVLFNKYVLGYFCFFLEREALSGTIFSHLTTCLLCIFYVIFSQWFWVFF